METCNQQTGSECQTIVDVTRGFTKTIETMSPMNIDVPKVIKLQRHLQVHKRI